MEFVYDDGGRSAYFKADKVGDCVTRAIAIAARMDYKEVYDLIRKTTGKTPRNGVFTRDATFKRFMVSLGFTWTPLMKIGSGCQAHLTDGEIPNKGRIICKLSKHWVAVVDGVIHDTYDSSRDGTRCVYGYWTYKGRP